MTLATQTALVDGGFLRLFPVAVSVGLGRAESEDDEIMTMLAAYLVGRS